MQGEGQGFDFVPGRGFFRFRAAAAAHCQSARLIIVRSRSSPGPATNSLFDRSLERRNKARETTAWQASLRTFALKITLACSECKELTHHQEEPS